MPNGTPQALARRVVLLVLLTATLMGMTIATPAARAQTPPVEGRVRLVPAMSEAPGDGGAFTVYVVVQDLQHNGLITYDDNGDHTPDRSVASDGMGAFQVTIGYDPSILAVRGAEPGPDLGRSGRSFQCLPPARQPDSFSFGCVSSGAGPAGPQGTLTLASITLVPQGQGLSPLSLDAEIAGPLGDSASIVVSGGAARVTGAVTTPTPPPQSSLTPGSTPGGPNNTAIPGTATEPRRAQPSPSPVTTRLATSTGVAGRPTGADATPGHHSPGSGGHSFGGATLWSVVVGGSVGIAGLLVLAGMIWRQRQHRGAA